MKTHIILIHVLLLSMSTILYAGNKEEAKKAFTRGKALYNENRFTEAADEFRKAHKLRPSWKLLFNIAQCSAAAKQYGPALEAFETYLSQGGDDVSKEKRSSVIEEIRILREMVGYLSIDAPEGAEILVNGRLRGRAPLPGPLAVGTGINHDLEVQKDGSMLLKKKVRVNSGNTLEIDANPKEQRSSPATAAAGPPAPRNNENKKTAQNGSKKNTKPLRIVGWTATGLGIGTLAAMVVTGVKTISLNEKGEEADSSKLQKYQKATNVLLAVGGTLTVAGVTILITTYITEKREKKRTGNGSKGVTFVPVLHPDAAGISLMHRF